MALTPLPLFTNNATSRLYAAIAAGDTSIRVEAGQGAKFPQPAGDGSNFFFVTLEDRRSGQVEICRCTGRSGDIMNVVRAAEGTAPQAFALGATVSNRFTAGTLGSYFDYAYSQSQADARFINIDGDAMTGVLTLPVGDPAAAQAAASKDYVDRIAASILQQTVSSASSLVYQGDGAKTAFVLSSLDIYGRTYLLSTASPNPVDAFVAGLKKVQNNTGGLGDYSVDVAGNRIVFDVAPASGAFVTFDIYTPRDVSSVVTVLLLKPFVPDGTATVFEMRAARDNSLAAVQNNEDVQIYVNNVPQKPIEDYTASGSVLTFSEAPEADADVWGVWTKTGG